MSHDAFWNRLLVIATVVNLEISELRWVILFLIEIYGFTHDIGLVRDVMGRATRPPRIRDGS